MCFGGKGTGGHQGGGSSQEDGEVRKAHREAGISAADTRRYFREKENPAHMRNKNAPGGTTSVSHSRDDGGNLVAKQVDYGQGSFAPPQGFREGDQSLAVNQQKAIRRDFIRDNKYLPDRSSLSEMLVKQDLSRTGKYQARSNQFRGKTPREIEAIRAANRKKNPADQDGDGSWLTSTDSSGIVYGIGTTFNPDGSLKGDGAQPAIYDPNLPEGYRGIPQVDPNRAVDTNLTMFGKAMRKVGGPIVANMMGPAAPIAGAMLLANKYPDKVPSFLTGKGTYAPAYDEPIGPNRPSTVAPPNQSETSSTSTSSSALSGIQSPYPQKRPTVNLGSPVFDRSETRLKNMGTSDIGALSSPVFRPQLRPASMNVSTLADANKGETIMVDGIPKQYAKKVPVSTYFRMDDPLGDDNNDNFDQVMPPVGEGSGEEQSIYDMYNYRKWLASNPTLIGQSSYGGKFGSGQPSYMASVAPQGIYSDGMAGSAVLTPFFNPTTGEYFNAPASNYYAEEGSNWRKGSPTEAYNLPIVA